MSLLDAIRYRMRAVFARADVEAEREAEFRFHQSLEQQQRHHEGLSPEEARRAARRRFGNATAYHQEVRQMSVASRLEAFARNVRLGLRSLARSPEFTLAGVLTLGVGIGSLTAVAVLVKSVMLTPLPFPESSRLVGVWTVVPRFGIQTPLTSDAAYLVMKSFSTSLQEIGSWDVTQVNLSDGDNPERVRGANATASFFRALGISPLLGRFYTEEEDRPGGPQVVILSEGLWRRRYGGDPTIVGRMVMIEGQPTEVLGVLPAGLSHPDQRIQLWLPKRLDPTNVLPTSTTHAVLARLKPGTTMDRARPDLQQALQRLPEVYPDAGFGFSTRQYMDMADPRIVLHPLRDDVVGDIGNLLWVLAGTAAFVLLVACANVATLFLVRAEARQREAAVCLALGARGGLTSRLLVEGLLLGTLGAVPEARLAEQLLPRAMTFVLRTDGAPDDLAPSARALMRRLDPMLPLFEFAPMAGVVSASMARTTFTAWMLAAAAGIALFLGVIGVYGVIAYMVGMRTREIGLRLALGARPGLVRRMIVNQGVRLVGAGIVAGLALTFMLTRSLQALLYGVSHNDPVTLLVVTAALGGAAILAAWIPATRAGRVDPAVTMGGE